MYLGQVMKLLAGNDLACTWDRCWNCWQVMIQHVLGTGVDQTGRPTIKSSGCSSHVGSLKVKFHGGASWLYNIFDHQIAKNLQHKLQDLVSTIVFLKNSISNAQDYIHSLRLGIVHYFHFFKFDQIIFKSLGNCIEFYFFVNFYSRSDGC